MTVDAPPTLPLRLAHLSGSDNIQMTNKKPPCIQHGGFLSLLPLATRTGFEPAISALTGRCVKPGYTTGPR